MFNIDDIIKFVAEKTGSDDVTEATDIENDLLCTGDDFHDLINAYSKRFNVDMNSYLWYFHAAEEGQSIGGNFFKAPYERVNRIPVTPIMLFAFAQKGKWDLNYPTHTIPKRRYDLLINGVILIIVVVIAIYYWIKK